MWGLFRDHIGVINRDPNIKALERKGGVVNQGSTFGLMRWDSGFRLPQP